jgi:D-2-hydroxyglutarate dehydrogenase
MKASDAVRKLSQLTHTAIAEPQFSVDWLRKVTPNPNALLCTPTSVAEVSTVLRWCAEHGVPVVPQGGNTGLVQGSVPRGDSTTVIVSTRRLTATKVNHDEQTMLCDAGVILESAQNLAEQQGFSFPLDMGSKGSCTVGGNAATNAGGIHVVRFGSFRSNILGLTAVLPDGQVLTMNKSLRKDNTGYDLKQLLIGSEGTLGLITSLTVALHPLPSNRTTLKLLLPSAACVERAFAVSKRCFGPSLGAFEVMDAAGLDAVSTGDVQKCRASFTVILDVLEFGQQLPADAALEAFASQVSSDTDVSVATTPSQQARLWEIREGLPVKLAGAGRIYKYDLSFSRSDFFTVVYEARVMLQACEGVVVTGYGHFGDGNVHLNIVDTTKQHHDFIVGAVTDFIYNRTAQLQGSISAEHGIGWEKKPYFLASAPPHEIEMMRSVKRSFDTNGIMNPGVLL